MCVPIKQNLQDYAAHSIIEDTQLLYHNFRKCQAEKKRFFRPTGPTGPTRLRGATPWQAGPTRLRGAAPWQAKKTKKGLLKYELAFTFSGNSRSDPR